MSTKRAAERLKFARILTGLTIRAFCQKYPINEGYLLKQESFNRPLTLKAAKKIHPYLLKEGVECTLEWILLGKGDMPTLTSKNYWKELSGPDDGV